MSLPALIRRLTSFTAFQQAQGDNGFPGTQIDTDLDQTNNTVNALRSLVALLVREDGKLGNGVVTRNSLAADLQLGVGAARPWDATIQYQTDDTVTRRAGLWQAVRVNLGYDPATDNGTHWTLVADLSQALVIADGGVGPNALTDNAVTQRAIADAAVGTNELADASLTRAKAATNLGVVPVGAEIDFAGISTPAGWLLCAGQAVSRTTYADLFAALTRVVTGSGTIGNSTITTGADDHSSLGLRGALIEGPGIPAGTIVIGVVAGAITLSSAVTATSAGGVFRVLPYGRGDGSTTFNLPDRRGRTVFGRDDMGGTGAGRFVQAYDGANLTASGGSAQFTLSNANLPASLPAATVQVFYPAHTYATRGQAPGASQTGSGTVVSDLWQSAVSASTNAPGPQVFNIVQPNPGGGTPLVFVPPSGVANRIIFAGV